MIVQDVFELRKKIIEDYKEFSTSFTKIQASDIKEKIDNEYANGRYWPDAMIQINPHYKSSRTIKDLVEEGSLHPQCAEIFQYKHNNIESRTLMLYKHQIDAIAKAQENKSFIVTTGTGSGKSLSFFVPIIDRILKDRESELKRRTSAIIIYPMNALANSQVEELNKYLKDNERLNGKELITFKRYTGQDDERERRDIADNPPDILLTNYMMLELMLTRYDAEIDRKIVENCRGLKFLVLDELHTYRGRQGADVAMLVRRVRECLAANPICIGTSATMKSGEQHDIAGTTVENAASKMFGVNVTAEDVIGETLERVTEERKIADIKESLAKDVREGRRRWREEGYGYEQFRNDPMAVWVELTLGIDISKEKPERAHPITLQEAIKRLAEETNVEKEKTEKMLRDFLVSAQSIRTPMGKTPFAFKLHQFLSGPGRVSCTLEAEGERVITLDEQVYSPKHEKEKIPLFHTYFCRECGQEYHPVWLAKNRFEQRDIDDLAIDVDAHFGFIAPCSEGQQYREENETDLPQHWFEYKDGKEPKLKPAYKQRVPQQNEVDASGSIGKGIPFWYIQGKFGFCVRCLTSYGIQGKDINRLVGLSGEGRSSATTAVTLALMRALHDDAQSEKQDKKKVLGFVDNRQDAALQAGHFNDFMFLLMLRSGLWSALKASNGTIANNDLPEAVFNALGFGRNSFEINAEYMKTPHADMAQRSHARATMLRVLGYRLLYDQRRGWRHNCPNLEQLKMLTIDYEGLDELSCKDALLGRSDNSLASYPPSVRKTLIHYVFDEMRKRFCIDSLYLQGDSIEKTKRDAYEQLVEPWTILDDEKTQTARTLVFSKSSSKNRKKQEVDFFFVGPRSSIVRAIRHSEVWKKTDLGNVIQTAEEIVELIREILEISARCGIVQTITVDKGTVGYRLKSSCLRWCSPEQDSESVNSYFSSLYKKIAVALGENRHDIFNFEAREHTAQVDSETRKGLEQRFRAGEHDETEWKRSHSNDFFSPLPILYCSPTMELGVDISELNVVYMRNVPPTPANYAQRSGRAGRSGQPALIITYCAAQSPHDQWYFRNQAEIVQGVVRPPLIDLANKDLFDSHIHALWLSEVKYNLGSCIAPLVQLDSKQRPLQDDLAEAILSEDARGKALVLAKAVAASLSDELSKAPWYSDEYEEDLLNQASEDFNRSFERWRNLLEATIKQRDKAHEIMAGFTYSQKEKSEAERRRKNAEDQLKLLTAVKGSNASFSEFYVYRYLANQGFLPGYNFPRLPLMAWVPTRSGTNGSDRKGRMVSRARFLALSEFGPRSLIYHEGNTFRVVRAKLSAGAMDTVTAGANLATISACVCSFCGYCHLGDIENPEPSQNVCENCGERLSLEGRIADLYRIETVETKQEDHITANDEERQRQGYELQTTYQNTQKVQKARVCCGEENCADLSYSPSANLWRINKGWRRRKDKEKLGFYINPMSGYWSKQDNPDETAENNTPEDIGNEEARSQLIVPFVEDHRNTVTLKPTVSLSETSFATVQAALAVGIERCFQVETSEIAVEPLPSAADRRLLLFYESAEGGAGVLQRLITEKKALSEVARNALLMMHYHISEGPLSLESIKANDSDTSCVAGCYRCLLSYYNQPEHRCIDRRDPQALEFLIALANSDVHPLKNTETTDIGEANPTLSSWLDLLQKHSCNEPRELSKPIMEGKAVIDAYYPNFNAAVFIVPPANDVREYLLDRGLRIVVFSLNKDSWVDTLEKHREIFFAKKTEKGGEEL